MRACVYCVCVRSQVDYVEAGKKHRTVHGSYMKTAYVHYVAPTGKHVLLEYSGKSAKALSIGVVDAADAAAPSQAAMSRVRLTEGYTRTFEEVFDVTYIANKSLSVVTPEWTINIDAHVKPVRGAWRDRPRVAACATHPTHMPMHAPGSLPREGAPMSARLAPPRPPPAPLRLAGPLGGRLPAV